MAVFIGTSPKFYMGSQDITESVVMWTFNGQIIYDRDDRLGFVLKQFRNYHPRRRER